MRLHNHFLFAAAGAFVVLAASADDYIQSVCYPDVTPAPPCQAIIDIESGCTPNGTDPIDYLAHAECMCGGGFFPNWIGCIDCLYVHGNRSQANVDSFETILSSASNALCTGTPTASFADIFNNISNTKGPVDGAATGLKDQFPSQTAVSLYYTASGPQGLGAITGSATKATKTAAATTDVDSNGASQSSSASDSDSGSSSSSSDSATGSGSGTATAAASSSSSSGGAAATQIVGGLFAVVAGGIVAGL